MDVPRPAGEPGFPTKTPSDLYSPVNWIKPDLTFDFYRSETVAVLQQILETLQLSSIAHRREDDIRTRFWKVYKRAADEYDSDFLNKYNGDLDIILISAGLFSAVSATFIVGLQPDLDRDPNDTTHALLQVIAHSLNNSLFSDEVVMPSPWNGPPMNVVLTQCLLYASLVASFFAAFGAFLGKQWLSHYSQVDLRGNIDSRCRSRQRKLDGIIRWRLRYIIESFPLCLQISLHLFGMGIAGSIWNRQPMIAAIVIGAVTLGVLGYNFIIVTSFISPSSPFRTPAISLLHSAMAALQGSWLAFDKNCRSFKMQLSGRLSRYQALRAPIRMISLAKTCIGKSSRRWRRISSWAPRDAILATPESILETPEPHTLMVSSDTDGLAIAWIVETSNDPDVVQAASQMALQIQWPPHLNIHTLLVQLLDAFLGCFHGTPDGPRVIAHRRDTAVTIGRALIHLYVEKINLHRGLYDRNTVFIDGAKSHFSSPTLLSDHPHYHWLLERPIVDDTELGYICFHVQTMLPQAFKGTDFGRSHRHITHPRYLNIPDLVMPWMAHSLLHCLSDPNISLHPKIPIAKAFQKVLITRPPPHAGLLADSLLAVGCLMGLTISHSEIIKLDKGQNIRAILRRVLKQLFMALPDEPQLSNSGVVRWDEKSVFAFEFLEIFCDLLAANTYDFGLIASQMNISGLSLKLCRQIMRNRPSLILSDLDPSTISRIADKDGLSLFEEWACQALRTSVALSSDTTRPDGERELSHLEYKQILDSEDAIWLLDFGSRIRAQLQPALELKDRKLIQAISDTMVVLSAVPGKLSHSLYIQLLDFARWCMQESHPPDLHRSTAKFLHSRRSILIDPENASILSHFKTCGLSRLLSQVMFCDPRCNDGNPALADVATQVVQQKQTFDLDFDTFYLDIVHALRVSGTDTLIRDDHLQRCIEIATRIWEENSTAVSLAESWVILNTPTMTRISVDQCIPSAYHDVWIRVVWILLESGWIPPDLEMRQAMLSLGQRYSQTRIVYNEHPFTPNGVLNGLQNDAYCVVQSAFERTLNGSAHHTSES